MTRFLRRVALALPILLLLSSCIRLNADYVIHSQDVIDVTLDYGLQKSVLQELGQAITGDQLCSNMADARPQGSAIVPYEDDTFVGCKATFTGSLATIDSTGTNLKLADGVWTFELTGSDLEGTGQSGQLTEDAFADFRLSVTFPGEVLSHNGSSTVEGRTVTWADAADLLTSEGLLATGRDAGGAAAGSVRTALFAGLAIALVILAAVIAFLVMRGRRKDARAAALAAAQQVAYPGQQYGGEPAQHYPAPPYPAQPYPPLPETPSQESPWERPASDPASGEPDQRQPHAPGESNPG